MYLSINLGMGMCVCLYLLFLPGCRESVTAAFALVLSLFCSEWRFAEELGVVVPILRYHALFSSVIPLFKSLPALEPRLPLEANLLRCRHRHVQLQPVAQANSSKLEIKRAVPGPDFSQKRNYVARH